MVDRALIPNSMVIPGSSGSLQMVDHTLTDAMCQDMQCVSSSIYPLIISNVRGARQMLADPDWKAEDQKGARTNSSAGNNQGGDMPGWMFKEESNRGNYE